MNIEFNEELCGHILTLNKEDLKNKEEIFTCSWCGHKVEEFPCYLCPTFQNLIHEKCEKGTAKRTCKKMNYREKEHSHYRIVEIKKNES